MEPRPPHLSNGDPAPVGPWRARPVFISSTFKDMQQERDYLRSHIFPRIAEELARRRHHLEPIDLRLGVETATLGSEEARELLVLKVCLDEIKRSRPFLLVLLGDRYGWIPPEDRVNAAAQEQGFVTSAAGKSVTALEIEFGLLKADQDQQRRSLFFFRNPLPWDKLPASERPNYSDAHSPDPAVRAGHAKLEALKTRLKNDPELTPRVFAYSADWKQNGSKGEVTGLEAFGELVFKHLWHAIDEETHAFALLPPATWQEQEKSALAEFVEHRSRIVVGRDALLSQLRAIAHSPVVDGPLANSQWGACLIGTPGSGKSAVFARLYRELQKDPSTLLLANAAGGTQRGSTIDAMLRRFITELSAAAGTPSTIPDQASNDDVEAAFYSLLHRVSATRRVVVLLDALDQFEPSPRGRHLTWFKTSQWPANARIIATTLPCPAAEELSQWAGIEEIDLAAVTVADAAEIGRQVWAHYHRQLNPAVLKVLTDKTHDTHPACGNPLWLTLALEQLNLLDADDFARADRDFTGTPTERMTALLLDTADRMPPDIATLYGWLLEQSEKSFGLAATRSFAVAIALTQNGLRESDLLVLIPQIAAILFPGQPAVTLSDLDLASLRRSFRAHLIRRGQNAQLDFFHAQMRQAVQFRARLDTRQLHAIHHALADHLVALSKNDPLRETQLMFQLIAGNDAHHAALMLTSDSDQYSIPVVHGYASSTSAIQSLAQHILAAAPQSPNPHLLWTLACLDLPGLSPDQIASIAGRFYADLDVALAHALDLPNRQLLIQTVVHAFQRLANDDPANTERQRSLSIALDRLGELATAQGDLSAARRYFDESKTLGEFLAAKNAPLIAESSPPDDDQELPDVPPPDLEWEKTLDEPTRLRVQAIYAERLELKARSQQIRKEKRDLQAQIRMHRLAEQDSLCSSLDNLGAVAIAQGDLASALRYFTQSKDIREQIAAGDPYYQQWLHDLTVPPHELTSNEWIPPARTEWQNNLAVSFSRLGDLARRRGDFDEARGNFSKAHAIIQRIIARDPTNFQWRQSHWQFNLADSHRSLGTIAQAQGDLDTALNHHTAAKQIEEHLVASDPNNDAWQRSLALSLANLGHVALARNEPNQALRCYSESHAIFQRHAARDPANTLAQRDQCMSLDHLAVLAHSLGQNAEALRLWTAGHQIAQRLVAQAPTDAVCQRGLAASHYRLACSAQQTGDQTRTRLELQSCLTILQTMKQQGLAFDSWMTRTYDQLTSPSQ